MGTESQSARIAGPAPRPVDQLTEVARRFYLLGWTQVQIAQDLGLDPSTVSRYLKRARDEGIVRVEIRSPRRRNVDLGRRLADRYRLSRAIVAPTEDRDDLGALADVAAEYIGSLLGTGTRVGVGWGTTLSAVVRFMEPATVSNLIVAQLAGGLSDPVPGIQGHELVRQLATLYPGSHVRYLHAPSIVDSAPIRQAILTDRSVQAALHEAAASEIALVGIGEMSPSATMLRSPHITDDDRRRLLEAGVVGSMNTRFFDAAGRPAGHLDERTIAIEWSELEAIPTVVGIAAGTRKVAAIKGALATGSLDILVTDETTASRLVGSEE
jgi:DNA-binding transcriptional regulator LsrR (DeoR family)